MYIYFIVRYTICIAGKEGLNLAITEAQKKAMYKYHQKNIKRVPLDMQKTDYENLVVISSKNGKSVNGYIKEAIAEKIEREEKI